MLNAILISRLLGGSRSLSASCSFEKCLENHASIDVRSLTVLNGNTQWNKCFRGFAFKKMRQEIHDRRHSTAAKSYACTTVR
jgi:hypothetical protein